MNKGDAGALEKKALDTIRRESMLKPYENVIVALSGGADSMALLRFFLDWREKLNIKNLTAMHLNHGLRGSESDRDELFVREWCQRLNVPVRVFHADIGKEAARLNQGIEEAGRRVRYGHLASLARELDACVATAHTLSDNAETLLFNMARGSGLRGMCGIPPKREIKWGGAPVKVIRPFLFCTRSEIEQYCRVKLIEYINDSSNSDTSFARNRIRKTVIPQLKQINPGFEQAVSRLVKSARQDSEFLESLAQEKLLKARICDQYGGYDASTLAALPPALRTRAIRLAVREVDGEAALGLSETQIAIMERALKSGGALTLCPGLNASVAQGRFLVWPDENLQSEAVIALKTGIPHDFYGRIYRPTLMSLDEFEKRLKINKNLLNYSFNYDKIIGNVILRRRRQGDKFSPAGRKVTKTLKKLFNEQKIPSVLRDTVPVVCDDRGIVLVGGVGCDERVRIDSGCRRVMVLEVI